MTSIIHPDPVMADKKYQWIIDGLKQLGIPVVFAAVLLWFVLTRVDSALIVIVNSLSNHTNQAAEQMNIMNKDNSQTKELLLSIERLNQRVCFNTAKNNADRNECYK